MSRWYIVLLLAAACGDTVSVESHRDCRTPDERAQAERLLLACVGPGQPRSISVDDDTVDLAGWITACGDQVREIACQRVLYAVRRGSTGRTFGTVACDAEPLPSWAKEACGK